MQEKGFWDDTKHLLICQKLLLVHDEVSEAVRELRKDNIPGMLEELADVYLRLQDLAGFLNFDLLAKAEEKHEFNKTRPHKHGKVF